MKWQIRRLDAIYDEDFLNQLSELKVEDLYYLKQKADEMQCKNDEMHEELQALKKRYAERVWKVEKIIEKIEELEAEKNDK